MNTLASSAAPAAILYRPYHLLHVPRATWLVDDEQAVDSLPPPISPLQLPANSRQRLPGRCPSKRPAQLEANFSYCLVSISSDFTRNVFVCDFSEHMILEYT